MWCRALVGFDCWDPIFVDCTCTWQASPNKATVQPTIEFSPFFPCICVLLADTIGAISWFLFLEI